MVIDRVRNDHRVFVLFRFMDLLFFGSNAERDSNCPSVVGCTVLAFVSFLLILSALSENTFF